MILTEKLIIKINGKKLKYYNNLGYNCKNGDIIEIDIKDLTKGSHYLIDVKCDKCGNERKIPYKEYIRNTKIGDKYLCKDTCSQEKKINTNLEKYGCSNPLKSSKVREKMENTMLERYGVRYPIQSNEIKNKIYKTNLEKYGVEYPNKNLDIRDKFRKTLLQNKGLKFYEKDYNESDFDIYIRKVNNLTRQNKKRLLELWNGQDYYDGEYIKDNFILNANNKRYPTIDHKISVYYGFYNNIPIEVISNIDNLCFTKRSINSAKSILTEEEFKLIKPF